MPTDVPDLSTACTCSYQHMPHDGCDGRPQVERLLARLAAAEARAKELAEEVAELRACKFAVEQTPKQWSTAQAPTLEAVANTARGVMAEQRAKLLADALGRVLVKVGVLNGLPMTGPDLLCAAETFLAETP